MSPTSLDLVMIGRTITSTWGNSHAVTWRGLMRESQARGHRILFLEHDKPWHAAHRDLTPPPGGETALYESVEELKERFGERLRKADLVIVGSSVPQGSAVIDWVLERAEGATAFYDLDAPLTLERIKAGECEYLSASQLRRFDLYLSFSGGPLPGRVERVFGARCARALYGGVDPELFYPAARPEETQMAWHLGFRGTYHEDRQEVLDRLLLEPARRWARGKFAVAGAHYPPEITWPRNVTRQEHLSAAEQREFYNRQRFTLNITRADMIRAGWSPSVRLFEACACATPVISDYWEGMDHFFVIGREILISQSAEDTLNYLKRMPEERWRGIGERARARVLAEHTVAHRAEELERYAREILNARAVGGR